MVNDGRMMQGNPTCFCTSQASSMLWAMPAFGQESPIFFMASSNLSRFSALSMASAVAPIISTPYFLSTPCFSRASAQLSAVCPPMVGRMASGRSLAIIFSTTCHLIGSM